MRICIVGCGAVGSLFAANLATLDDVEVWAFDLFQAHVDAINRDGLRLSGAGDVHARLQATSDAAALPPCDFGIVATKAMHADAAIAATAHAFADGAVASVMNGVGNEETLARHVARVIRGTTFPAGKLLEPGHVQWDVKGDTTFSPVRAGACDRGRGRGARRCLHARRHAVGGRRRRAPGAVAQGDLQRLHQPDRRAHRPHARPRLRAPRPARARLRASSTRARPSRPRRGSRSTPIPRS